MSHTEYLFVDTDVWLSLTSKQSQAKEQSEPHKNVLVKIFGIYHWQY